MVRLIFNHHYLHGTPRGSQSGLDFSFKFVPDEDKYGSYGVIKVCIERVARDDY
jgi:hypothetical protein